MIGDTLINFFSSFGIIGMLLALYLIFLIDSMIFPALPDFFILIIYSANPDFGWGIILLFIAVLASFSGNTLLYLLVKKISIPKWIKKLMRKYSKILIMSDERILLLNRIAPVLPYTGAFIAINNWDYKKAISYIVVGGFAKFGCLLLLSGTFHALFEEGVAQNATLALIVVVIVISFILSYIKKKKMGISRI